MTTLPAGPSFTEADVVRVAEAIEGRRRGMLDNGIARSDQPVARDYFAVELGRAALAAMVKP